MPAQNAGSETKKAGVSPGFLSAPWWGLGGLDVGSLLAFGALRDFELDLLTFLEGLESVHVNRGEMGEQIFAAIIRSNEAKTLRIIEPLYCACCHERVSFK